MGDSGQTNATAADASGRAFVFVPRLLDRAADRAEDGADLAAQEDEGDDRDDRDEGEDQRVLREALAFLIPTEEADESVKHRVGHLLSGRSSPATNRPPEAAQTYGPTFGLSIRRPPDRVRPVTNRNDRRSGRRSSSGRCWCRWSDRAADRAEDRADLAAQ